MFAFPLYLFLSGGVNIIADRNGALAVRRVAYTHQAGESRAHVPGAHHAFRVRGVTGALRDTLSDSSLIRFEPHRARTRDFYLATSTDSRSQLAVGVALNVGQM